jgi:O-methyltransferase involved in polyketide biosynthesis
MAMPRTDDDSWEITQSVGATALGVAAARAAETESENPLINDPFARVFLDAAGEGMWSIYANPTLLAKAADIDPDVRARARLLIDFMATRTAFFDEFFLSAADAGVRQVVILAPGPTAPSCTSSTSLRCWTSNQPPCASTVHIRRHNW